jgi:serine phosphatase RsbU (regulator of sigma subunit)
MRDSLQNYSTIQKQFQDDFKRKLEADSLKMIKQEKKLAHSQLAQEQSYRWYLLAFLILIIVFGAFMYKRYQITVKQNRIINMQHKAVEKQRNQIAQKNDEILASINYAKRIQATILPSERKISRNIPNSYVVYLPKDIISGDFYWVENNDALPDTVLFAVCDCTGHGVPGALVSLVCHNALNRAVKELGLLQPSLILDCAADLIIENFSKNNKANDEIKDGMDLALCALNTKTGELQFAGAQNPIWIFKANHTIVEIKGDKQPIGKIENRLAFTNKKYQLENNDTIYLFSDGFADQFGGQNGKKLQRGKFKELIHKIHHLPLNQQQNELISFFESYKGKFEQIDDVCVMAVKFINAN